MKSNFEFLRRYWPALAEIGATAEGYLFTDPNSCIFKLGMFGERVVSEIFAVEHLRTPEADDSQAARIRILKREGLLPSNIDDIFYTLRQQRNKAVHAGLDSLADAKTLLEMTYRLACWFMEVYGDWGYIPDPFIMPEKEVAVDYASLLAEKEAEIVKLNARVTAVVTAASAAPKQERKQKSEQVAASSDATEAETRLIIDCQLRAAGWEADTQSLRYANGTRPVKGRNLAIAEWPTTAQDGDDGRADYALFIGLQMVGIIEAKRISIDVPGVVDGQCREYAAAIREEDKPLCIGEWGGYYVPFLFAANGRRYVEQWKEKSGVWFRDVRNPANKSRALRGWMSPEGLTTLLSNNPATANAKLENTPYDLLRDPDGLHLRDYQIRAIEAAEKAIINGQKAVLLSMATGTGKTRTVLGMIYRFLSTNRFRRILFLVDRNSLGEQAQDVFKEVKLEELLTLDNIYNIRELGQQGFDAETRIKVATVQSMVRHLLNDEEASISVSDYDLIIVDEAHRGYTMDKELSETEMLYRDEADYRNHYTGAILYLKEGHARVVASGASGTATDDEDFTDITIPGKTILINENREHRGDIDRDVYHECGHYEWHSMFFELQDLHASDLRMLDYQEADDASKPAEKDIRWVERQASFVGIAAMFPRPVFEPMVRKYWKEVANNQDNLGQKLAGIISKIASDKQKARSIIKTRMITMGTSGAKGALNYIDGHYIANFAFDADSLSSGETFVISRSQFTEMYEKDAHFREVINSRAFVYADGHICLNQSQYVGSTKKGYLMTKWALGHVDQCCMKFSRTYHISADHYRVGELHYDDEYNECYLMVHSLDISGMSGDELEEKNLEYLGSLPRRPSKALTKLLKDRVKTQRGLAAATGLSEAKISRMCNEDDYEYSIQDVTRLIIGLQLPPLLSSLFLEMTRFTRTVMVRYYRYQCIIDCLFMEDIETVVESHKKLFDE